MTDETFYPIIPGTFSHVLACRKTPVSKVAGLLPKHYLEFFEQHQGIRSCCRHPENHLVEARYSGPKAIDEGKPDIYIFTCTGFHPDVVQREEVLVKHGLLDLDRNVTALGVENGLTRRAPHDWELAGDAVHRTEPAEIGEDGMVWTIPNPRENGWAEHVRYCGGKGDVRPTWSVD